MIRRRCAEFCRFANHQLTANPVFPGIGPAVLPSVESAAAKRHDAGQPNG